MISMCYVVKKIYFYLKRLYAMTKSDIIRHRLFNQQIAETDLKKPEEVVTRMVAMQAQEYAMAKWAIGLRLPGSTDAMIEQSFNKGAILRTHLMRPTWHFVTPADVQWLLQLTAPRVAALNAYTYRQQKLDSKVFKRSNDIIGRELEGGKHLLRGELQSALANKKILADGLRLISILMQAELDGVICSGARRGNQQTYALLEQRIPKVKPIQKEEALKMFAERYFASRGPASERDFSTWSGLSLREARQAIKLLHSEFVHEKFNAQTLIFLPRNLDPGRKIQDSFLMPDYDEYGMSYRDRTALREKDDDFKHFTGENPAFNRMIIINGKITGTWKRNIKTKKVRVEIVPFRPLSKVKQQVLKKSVQKYCSFLGLEPAS